MRGAAPKEPPLWDLRAGVETPLSTLAGMARSHDECRDQYENGHDGTGDLPRAETRTRPESDWIGEDRDTQQHDSEDDQHTGGGWHSGFSYPE